MERIPQPIKELIDSHPIYSSPLQFFFVLFTVIFFGCLATMYVFSDSPQMKPIIHWIVSAFFTKNGVLSSYPDAQ